MPAPRRLSLPRPAAPRPARRLSRALSGLRINAARLNETLHHTCQWGAAHRYGSGPTQTGMARLALSDDDARARRWFADETQRLGCRLAVDQMGNMFARRPGARAGPMIAMGSHLDTQPRGGRYDGILGVVAAVEVLRTLAESGVGTRHAVGAVNWTNEEGARFPRSMLASGVWAGVTPLETAWAVADVADPTTTVKTELDRLGYAGAVACGPAGVALAAHLELHIEQGPLLERAGKRLGVVGGAQAYRWLSVAVDGRGAHTGTTPLDARRDAVLAAAKMIVASDGVARELGALAATGAVTQPPGASVNTVASRVAFTLDLRHPDDGVVAEAQARCLAAFAAVARAAGVGLAWTVDTDSPAVRFDAGCVRAVEAAAAALVGPGGWMALTSGAGHDSVYTSRRCPTAMIFVPCRGGVSHHPEEHCSPEDCALGAQALLEAVLLYDRA